MSLVDTLFVTTVKGQVAIIFGHWILDLCLDLVSGACAMLRDGEQCYFFLDLRLSCLRPSSSSSCLSSYWTSMKAMSSRSSGIDCNAIVPQDSQRKQDLGNLRKGRPSWGGGWGEKLPDFVNKLHWSGAWNADKRRRGPNSSNIFAP